MVGGSFLVSVWIRQGFISESYLVMEWVVWLGSECFLFEVNKLKRDMYVIEIIVWKRKVFKLFYI